MLIGAHINISTNRMKYTCVPRFPAALCVPAYSHMCTFACKVEQAVRPHYKLLQTPPGYLTSITALQLECVCVCVCVCACVIGTRHGCTRRAPRWGWSRHCWWPRCSGPRTSSAASTWAWWRWTWCSDPNPPRPSPAPTRACAPCRPAGGDKHYYDWPQKSAAFQGNELLSAINYWMN